jgi:ABC-type lipoprotein export system ATPase subunit/ABC-type antimicrobial peptide transport system permease subunit
MIELKNVNKSFFEKTALTNISFKLPSKGIFFVVGRSGSGKSTLLNLIGGLDKPSSGELLVNGLNTASFKDKDWDEYRNKNVGFVFQEYYLQESLSVKENLLLPLELQKKSGDKEDKVKAALKAVNLTGFEERKVITLSGGEKQRVSIARAIIKNPLMVLADEPTGALDSKSGNEVFKILQDISREKLVLVVSHDLGFAKEYGEGIIELSDGKLISNNIPSSLENNDENKPIKIDKQHISFKETFLLAWHYLKEKPLRLIISILLSVTSLGLFGLFDSLASVDNLDVAANSLISSGDQNLTVGVRTISHTSLSDDDISSLKKSTGLSFFGECSFETINLLDYIPTSFPNYYFQFFYQLISNGISSTDVSSLPQSFSLLAGTYPLNDNEIVLTDYQYELFHKSGFVDKNNDGSFYNILEPKDLVGKTLGPLKYKICGVLDTDFDMEHFKPLLDFLEYNKNGNLLPSDAIEKLGSEINSKRISSFYNTVIASPNIIESIKKTVDAYGNNTREGLGNIYSSDLALPVNALQNTAFCFGPNLYEDVAKKTVLFSTDEKINDKSLVISLSDYVETLYRAKKLESQIQVTIPKRFIYGASEDKTETVNPLDFLSGISSLGISFVVDEHYSEAFAQKLFDINQYAESYYENKATSVPEVIPESDKKGIYGLFVESSYSYRSSSDQYAASLFDEITAINSDCLQHYYSVYKDTYFSYRHFSIPFQKDYENSKDVQTFDFLLAGLSFKPSTMIVSQNVAKTICYEVGGYYSFLLLAMPKNTENLKKLLRIHYDNEGTSVGYYIDNYSLNQITSLTNSLFIYKNVFLPVAIISAVFSCLLLLNYLTASVADKKREIGILRALGAKKSDVISIFFLETLIISLVCFALSLVVLFTFAPLINKTLMASSGVLVTIFMPGMRQILILLALSLFVSFLSAFFPIKNIARTTPISIIRS